MQFDIDITIIVGFFLLNLIFGIYHGKGIHSLKYYAIGNRNFSNATITATIIATWIGAGFFSSAVSETYNNGLWHIIARIGDPLTLLIVGTLIAPKIHEFFGKLTVAEVMDHLYGKTVRIITAICSITLSIGYIAVQIKVFSTLFAYFFKIPYVYAVLIGSSIIIIYSSIGGILSVTFTDVIQLFTFGVFTPVFAFFLWMIFGSSKETIANTLSTNPLFNCNQVFDYHNMNFYASLLLFIYFTIPALDPATFQRILMSRDVMQVRKSFIYSALLCLIIGIAACCIGIIALAHNPNIDPNNLLFYVIEHWSFPGLKGWILTAVLAMGMSTADSYINSASVIFSNDICRPLGIRILNNDLLVTRICAFFIGLSAILLVLYSNSLFELLLFAGNFYTPIITVPLMLAILGFRSTSKSVIIGMLSGLITVVIWRSYVQKVINIDSIIPGTLANLIGLVTAHYLLREPGGWVELQVPEPIVLLKLERKRKYKQLMQAIKKFKIINFFKNTVPNEAKYFSVFGIFIIISTYSAMYMIPPNIRALYQTLYNNIYHSVFFLSFGFITYPVWKLKFNNETFVAIIWNIGVFYMFICVAMVLTIISGFEQMQLMILIFNLMAIGVLFRWKTTLFMTITGIIVTTCLFKLLYNNITLVNNINDIQLKIIYFLLLFSGVLVAFLKPKQQHEERTAAMETYLQEQNRETQLELIRTTKHREEFVNRLDQQCIEVFKSIHNQINLLEQDIKKRISKNKKATLLKIIEQLKSGAEYLDEVILSITNQISINPIKISLEQFIYNIIEKYKKLNRPDDIQLTVQFKNKNIDIIIDPNYIKKMLYTCLNHCLIDSNLKEATIIIEDDKIEYESDPNISLKLRRDAIKLSIICKTINLTQHDINQMLNFSVNSINKINFAEVHKIITSHYGEIYVTSNNEQIIYSIILPTNLKEIMPKKQQIPDREWENFKVINNLVTNKIKELTKEIAKQLIQIGMDLNTIAKITKLQLQEIKELEI